MNYVNYEGISYQMTVRKLSVKNQISISMKSMSPFKATVGSASSLHVEKLPRVGWELNPLFCTGK